MCDEGKSNDDVQEPSLADKFSKLFSELEHCPESEQRKKIEEMNELVEEINKEEFELVFNEELYDKIYKMIEEKKISMENALLLVKHIGYNKTSKSFWIYGFVDSSLCIRFEQMIVEEEQKKEEKNEKLMIDLCECYLLLIRWTSSKLIMICMPCVLKVAMNKEESEEAQKEVEMALLALSNISFYTEIEKEAYLKKITEIIKHQQKHRNLTKLAYQSAWEFLIKRFTKDRNLEDMIVNELHFGREASRELEELTRCIDWKKKGGEEMNKEETKEEVILRKWIETISIYFRYCSLQNEEFVELINSIVQIYRAAKDNHRRICNWCIYSLRNAAERRVVKVEDLLKGGAVEAVLEEIYQLTLDDDFACESLHFFMYVSSRLKEKVKDEKEEEKRKAIKRKIFEKMEEEGYEDIVVCFQEIIDFINGIYYKALPLNITDYFVNI
ncbi:uncharacterized protein MONOS_9622 [Monocercomonoides exilis]|uniref:uncharacterized protein n=1 Tax=Monocercomonoides exilis TaxID=2049356 RepID=UPI003559520A|nr:hypothetical protein MONOS_9622 [Monocercomonoides exilis]|eukprot:MONOS_9622.1-p1 / transcript=MONOS_9622.1 / gene=MONOS_9622 / organism=Monocercomonoides_exilis_PA203 / gene_product=unspecified product / transcript_product=unspecified product / location=Mono_scaffold00403:27208-28657(-) / protein_length=442 / sequence_SO=supercontig / SO=protein_coding / is_pseudo=false